MPISYDKLIQLFKDRGITSYTITKKDRIIGQGTWDNIHYGKNVSTHTIGALCEYLDCQPGDILEYIPEAQKSVHPIESASVY